MGKVFKNKKCDVCGKVGKVIETWGKRYCKECWDKKPKKGGGHSGMRKMKNIKGMLSQTTLNKELDLIKVPKGNKFFATLFLEHYPESKGIVGRQVNYIILNRGQFVGIIGGNSPPLNYKKFNEYFGKGNEKLFLNNNVFRIVKSHKNQATMVLKQFRLKVQRHYKDKYGDTLIGLITFVEPPRTGAIYKADNWDYLGMTEGKKMTRRGDHGKWINKEWSEGTKKHIFAIKLK